MNKKFLNISIFLVSFFLWNLNFPYLCLASPLLLTTTESEESPPQTSSKSDKLEIIIRNLQSVDHNLGKIQKSIDTSSAESANTSKNLFEIQKTIQNSTKELTNAFISQDKATGIGKWTEQITIIAIATFIGLIITLINSRLARKRTKYDYLARVWYDICKIELENPDFTVMSKTKNFKDLGDKYDIFARICWVYIYDIWYNRLWKLYLSTIERTIRLHFEWFEENKNIYFEENKRGVKKFFKKVEDLKLNMPNKEATEKETKLKEKEN